MAIASKSASVLAGCSARTATTNGKDETVEMTPGDFIDYRAQAVPTYADDLTRSRGMTPERVAKVT